MTSGPPPQCLSCAHLRSPIVNDGVPEPPWPGGTGTCGAYPDGIPRAIWVNLLDHRQPQLGDQGVQWEPLAEDIPFPNWAMQAKPGGTSPHDGGQSIATRGVLGHDVTPGHDELHHWWVYGEGRQRWRTWTELRDQLIEHVGPVKAERYASKWFIERYGYAAGSDVNRVKHGKPPRGHVVGPG